MDGESRMIIGLVRHFKVKHPLPEGRTLTAEELEQWFTDYDLADIEYGEALTEEMDWAKCYTSTMPRALNTARHLFKGEITERDGLRELPAPVFKGRRPLPFFIWALRIRLSPYFHKQTKNNIDAARIQIRQLLDETAETDGKPVLIVSHAAKMVYLRKELIARGFTGPSFHIPKNGKLYLFKK